jgi:hypothetical protein
LRKRKVNKARAKEENKSKGRIEEEVISERGGMGKRVA